MASVFSDVFPLSGIHDISGLRTCILIWNPYSPLAKKIISLILFLLLDCKYYPY